MFVLYEHKKIEKNITYQKYNKIINQTMEQKQEFFTVTEYNNHLINDNCAICLENININQVVIKTICGHIFHKKCFTNYSSTKYNQESDGIVPCPLCKQDACNINYYFKLINDFFFEKNINIKVGDLVRAKTFGNMTFTVTGFTKVFYSNDKNIKYYKKFYNGIINNFMKVSIQREDLEKIHLDKCIITCNDCNQQSITNYIDFDNKHIIDRLNDLRITFGEINNSCLVLLNYEDDIFFDYSLEFKHYNKILFHECMLCNSFKTKLINSI
jgi:hypothetical protein